jgi:hypothetical protein
MTSPAIDHAKRMFSKQGKAFGSPQRLLLGVLRERDYLPRALVIGLGNPRRREISGLFLQPMPAANPSLPPAKKRKVATKQHDDLAHTQRLEELLLEAVSEGTSLNPLVDLLDAAQGAEDPQVLFKCIYALYRVFASVIDTGMLVPTPDVDAKVVRAWIWEKFNVFTEMLVGLMNDSEKSLRVSAVPYPHPGYQSDILELRGANSLFPPQALVVFFVIRPGCLGAFRLA